jgi:hypothetical protein
MRATSRPLAFCRNDSQCNTLKRKGLQEILGNSTPVWTSREALRNLSENVNHADTTKLQLTPPNIERSLRGRGRAAPDLE